MACNYCFPTRTTFQINSEFWKEGIFRWENRTSCLVGLKTHPTIVPRSGIELTTSRLHNFIMAKVQCKALRTISLDLAPYKTNCIVIAERYVWRETAISSFLYDIHVTGPPPSPPRPPPIYQPRSVACSLTCVFGEKQPLDFAGGDKQPSRKVPCIPRWCRTAVGWMYGGTTSCIAQIIAGRIGVLLL